MLAAIPSPSANGFHIGPLFVHAYGLAYIVGVAAAVYITRIRWKARGGDPDLVYEVALWGFPAGIVGGRLYFIATSFNQMPKHWWGPFAVWDGGMGIWGGIALGSLVAAWVLRRRGANIPLFMEAAAPGVLVAQGIGRIGNYFNQELYGAPSSLPWALEISPQHRYSGYLAYSTFEPMFLYELIWDFVLAGLLALLGKLREIRAPGLFALYVAGYSGFRIFEETQRIDPSHYLWGMRLNFYVASGLCFIGLCWFIWLQVGASVKDHPRSSRRELSDPA